MFAFFDVLVELIHIVVGFIANMFVLLMSVVSFIIRSVGWLILCISYLPGWLSAFVLVPVTLSVIFQVINKGD